MAALKFAGPWADFEYGGRAKLKALPGHEVYTLTPEQLAAWKKAAEPLDHRLGRRREEAGLDPTP